MIHFVTFSKDRLPQCELLLRSLFQFHQGEKRVTMLLKVTSSEMQRGYGNLQRKYEHRVRFVGEKSLTADVQQMVESVEADELAFVMDDDVYTQPWGCEDVEYKRFLADPRILSLCLRCTPVTDFCFSLHRHSPPPAFRPDRTWFWPSLCNIAYGGDWGYPHSLDSNVYRRADILPIIREGKFESVNFLEPALRPAMKRPLMICYATPRFLNISNTTVQSSHPQNRDGGMDQGEMNTRFLAGERIALEPLREIVPRSAHISHPYDWEPNPDWDG